MVQCDGPKRATQDTEQIGSAKISYELHLDVTNPPDQLANARIGDKTKENKEESERQAENQRNAGSSYTSPEPEAMQSNETLSGLPWGGINMKHIIETGKRKELGSKQTSQANSLHGGATGGR